MLLTLIAVALLMPLARACAFSRVLQAANCQNDCTANCDSFDLPTVTFTPDLPKTSAVGRVLNLLDVRALLLLIELTRSLRREEEPTCRQSACMYKVAALL